MNIESSVNLLLEELDAAVLEEDFEKIEKIGTTIETLLEELNADTIRLRIVQ